MHFENGKLEKLTKILVVLIERGSVRMEWIRIHSICE